MSKASNPFLIYIFWGAVTPTLVNGDEPRTISVDRSPPATHSKVWSRIVPAAQFTTQSNNGVTVPQKGGVRIRPLSSESSDGDELKIRNIGGHRIQRDDSADAAEPLVRIAPPVPPSPVNGQVAPGASGAPTPQDSSKPLDSPSSSTTGMYPAGGFSFESDSVFDSFSARTTFSNGSRSAGGWHEGVVPRMVTSDYSPIQMISPSEGFVSSPTSSSLFRSQTYLSALNKSSLEQSELEWTGYSFETSERLTASAGGVRLGLGGQHGSQSSKQLRLGPFYLGIDSVESGVLGYDYRPTTGAAEDGVIGFVGMRLRGAVELFPSLALSVDGTLYYLIGPNEFAWSLNSFSGFDPTPVFSLDYYLENDPWTIRLYDRFGVGSFYDNLDAYYSRGEGSDLDEFSRSGRYNFGYLGYGYSDRGDLRSDVSDGFDFFYYNVLGGSAQRALGEDFVFSADAGMWNHWDSDFAESEFNSQRIGSSLDYDGPRIPFSPGLYYDAYSFDYFDSAYHRIAARGEGRLTQRVWADGEIGYRWDDLNGSAFRDDDSIVWGVGIHHEISERTYHGARAGNDYFPGVGFSGGGVAGGSTFASSFGNSVNSEYLSYYLSHLFSEHLSFYAFSQWSGDSFVTGNFAGESFDTELHGGRLRYQHHGLNSHIGYYHEKRHRDIGAELERSLVHLHIDKRLTDMTDSYFSFFYEDAPSFDEYFYILGVRRNF